MQSLIEIETKLRMSMATSKYAIQTSPKPVAKPVQPQQPLRTPSPSPAQPVAKNGPLESIAAKLAASGDASESPSDATNTGGFSSANTNSSPLATSIPLAMHARSSAPTIGPTSPLAVEGIALRELDEGVGVVDLDDTEAAAGNSSSRTSGRSTGRTSGR